MHSRQLTYVLALSVSAAAGVLSFSCAAADAVASAPAAPAAARSAIHIEAQKLEPALKALARARDLQVVFVAEDVRHLKTRGASGELTAEETLRRLLEGTGLTYRYLDAKTVTLVPAATSGDRASGPETMTRVASAAAAQPQGAGAGDPARKSAAAPEEEISEGMSEILVSGSRVINLDVPRTRDDVQPYVVFDSAQIQASQATNLGDFFRTRLPMATPSGPEGLGPFSSGGGSVGSAINLRGLGSNQTLILVDGRPVPAVSESGGYSRQGDINGIPLAMIERVEVLPSTASGIYGGGATGGVINIITRKDFSGSVLTLNYINTFDTDSAQRRADLTSSWSLRDGATLLTLTGSYADANEILAGDRDFARRANEARFENYPTNYTLFTSPDRGYTTNIRSANGSNLVLKSQYGGTALNAPITHVPVGYAGIGSDSAAGLVANAGRYNLDLPASAVGGADAVLVPTNPVKSLGLGVRQTFTSWLDGYADYFHTTNQGTVSTLGVSTSASLSAAAPNNPFTQAINVSFPVPGAVVDTVSTFASTRASAGLIGRLPGGWQTAFDYTWARTRYTSRRSGIQVGDPDGSGPGLSFSQAVTGGVLDVMRDLNVSPLNLQPYQMPAAVSDFVAQDYPSIVQAATIRASGPVYRLPAGDIVVSTSVDWKRDRNEDAVFAFWRGGGATGLTYRFSPSTDQTNRSVYAEAKVPLLASRRDAIRRPALEMQLAARHDTSRTRTYSDDFDNIVPGPDGPFPAVGRLSREVSDTTYTAGLRYVPVTDLTLRASIGTGFLAPSRDQLSSGYVDAGAFYTNFLDPKRDAVPTTVGPVDVLSGGDAALRPEQSESISAGVIYTPRALPGLRVSVDYTRITKTDEITYLTLQQMLDLEDLLPGVIERAPLTANDRTSGFTGGVITQLDFRPVNLARREVEAVDVQADYTLDLPGGELHFYGMATWNRRFAQQPTPDSEKLDTVRYFGGPLEWSGHAGVDWRRGPWSAGWNAHYFGEQLVYFAGASPLLNDRYIRSHGTDHYPDQFYHDVQAAYQFGPQETGWRQLFSGVRVSAGLQNVFNSVPPLRPLSGPLQPLEDPRLRRYSLNFQKTF